jgi:hypothetical protein
VLETLQSLKKPDTITLTRDTVAGNMHVNTFAGNIPVSISFNTNNMEMDSFTAYNHH